MKKTGMILALAILLPLSAFAGKKKQPPQPDTDWLNAPTPDGSPTLKETSDWLAKTLQDYGGYHPHCGSPGPCLGSFPVLSDVGIDNTCTFRWTEETNASRDAIYSYAVPLGAVTEITVAPTDDGLAPNLTIKTGQVTAISAGERVNKTHEALASAGFDLYGTPPPKLNAPAPESKERMAPRIQKALQHAVDLCRSTYQAPAQAKQLF